MGRFGKVVALLCGSIMLLFLSLSCGGGGGGGGDGGVTLTGTVRAPGGAVAFIQPTRLQRFLAGILGAPAHASIQGLSAVPNATVELVEVDADGADVVIIATAVTDGSGMYSIEAPEGFEPDTRYVVRVTGTTDVMDSRVTGTAMDIDPVTDAASGLVTGATAAGGLSSVTILEVEEILEVVDDVAGEIDPAGLDSMELTEAVTTATNNSEEATNVISSTTASGEICGRVTDSGNDGLASIRIAVFDFENQVTRARTKTASNGTYCVNVPVQGDTDVYTGGTSSGEYTLAAFNRTGETNDPGRHASEFYSISGAAYNMYNADKLTLTPASPTLTGVDLKLEPGARITGTVTGHDTAGAGLKGIKVTVRDFETLIMVASAPTGADGTYRVNVIPGRYLVGVRNTTIWPYASEIYDGGTGTPSRNLGIPVAVTAGQVRTLDFELAAGSRLSGTVTDGASSLPVSGIGIYIDDAANEGAADRLRTNKLGKYSIWLRSGLYDIFAYGQRSLNQDLTGSQVLDFSATVSTISGIVEDTASDPVREVKMRLYDGATRALLSRATTNSDGTYTIYTDQTGDHRLEGRVDGPSSTGGLMYMAHTRHDSGDVINIPAPGASATADMTLPAGGVLKMIAYEGNGAGTPDRSSPVANERFLLRDDDDLGTAGSGTGADDIFFGIRTRGDGTVSVTLPAGIYDRLRLPEVDSGAGSNACGAITITAGQITTVEFFDGDNTCIK